MVLSSRGRQSCCEAGHPCCSACPPACLPAPQGSCLTLPLLPAHFLSHLPARASIRLPPQLLVEVVQQLQRMFTPDVKVIKRAIDSLIDVRVAAFDDAWLGTAVQWAAGACCWQRNCVHEQLASRQLAARQPPPPACSRANIPFPNPDVARLPGA